jgi:hypothetical protein
MARTKFDYEDEALKQIVKVYETTVTDLEAKTSKLTEELLKICQRTHYKRFVEMYTACVDFYTDNLQKAVIGSFNEWNDGHSGDNLVMHIRRYEGGDDAERTATGLQNDLKRQIEENMFKDMSPGDITTANPSYEEADIEAVRDLAVNYSAELESIRDTADKAVESGKETNDVYSCVEEPISVTTNAVLYGFSSLSGKFEEFQSSANDARTEVTNRAASSAAEKAMQAAQKAQDDFDSLKGFNI